MGKPRAKANGQKAALMRKKRQQAELPRAAGSKEPESVDTGILQKLRQSAIQHARHSHERRIDQLEPDSDNDQLEDETEMDIDWERSDGKQPVLVRRVVRARPDLQDKIRNPFARKLPADADAVEHVLDSQWSLAYADGAARDALVAEGTRVQKVGDGIHRRVLVDAPVQPVDMPNTRPPKRKPEYRDDSEPEESWRHEIDTTMASLPKATEQMLLSSISTRLIN